MKVIIFVIYVLLIVVVATVSVVVLGLVALLSLPFDKERKMVMALSQIAARTVFLLSPVWRVKVEGAEKCDPRQTYVITANHQSFFDIPFLFYLPLWKFKFVSKVEVRKIPAIGWMLGMRGDIVIRRGTAAAAATVKNEGAAHLGRGTSVVIFPEGTRTKDGEVHRFKEGAFRLAQDNRVPILPCVVYGTSGILGLFRLTPRTLRLRVLDPIGVEEIEATPVREMAQRVEQLTRNELSLLRAESE